MWIFAVSTAMLGALDETAASHLTVCICVCVLSPPPVLSIQMKRNRLESGMRQSLSKGLTLALQRAFNDSSVRIQVGITAACAYWIMNQIALPRCLP